MSSLVSNETLLQQLNEKINRAEIPALVKNRIKIFTSDSDIYKHVNGKIINIDHELNLNETDILTASVTVKLKCIKAEYGYAVNDYATNWGISNGAIVLQPNASITSKSINFVCGTSELKAIGQGSYQTLKSLTSENWRFVFILKY